MQVKSNDKETVTFVITDLYGKVLINEQSYNPSSDKFGTDLEQGVYVLRIMKGHEVAIQRLIKK